MDRYSMIFLVVFLLSIVVIIGCVISLIIEKKQKRELVRANRRKHLNDCTVETILGYQARRADSSLVYRHRA